MTLPKHLAALDGLRGVAVTLVIASHAFPMLHELPWTIKRFSNLGFYGVQLFFIVSSVTLANSWRRTEVAGSPSLYGFAVRRVFRIAPAYFLAAVGYAWLLGTGTIDSIRVMTFLTFTNGWTPAQMPTVPTAWVGVPGGWSVEAEFAFYAAFPILMMTLRGLRRAVIAFAASLPLAWAANQLGAAAFTATYGATATDQFLYYWLPNQLPVFLCGLVAYELIVRLALPGAWRRAGCQIARAGPAMICAASIGFAMLAIVPWPRLPQPSFAFLPSHVIAAVAFGTVTIVLALRPLRLITQWSVVALGRASFSAYLVHFAVIAGIESVLPDWIVALKGIPAVLMSGMLFVAVLALTGVLAQLTYRLIEMPAIRLGASVIGRRDVPSASSIYSGKVGRPGET